MGYENSLGAVPTSKLGPAAAAFRAKLVAKAQPKPAPVLAANSKATLLKIPIADRTEQNWRNLAAQLTWKDGLKTLLAIPTKYRTATNARHIQFLYGVLGIGPAAQKSNGVSVANPLAKPISVAIAKTAKIAPGGAVGKLANFGSSLLAVAAVKPTTDIHKTTDELIRAGINSGKAAEGFVTSINPLNKYLEKFDAKGKKAGGLGKFFGGLGELVRTHPIATIAIVYTAVVSWPKVSAYLASPEGAAAVDTAGTYMGYAETAMKLGDALSAARGAKPTDINPDNGMPYTALNDHQDLASIGGPKAILIGVGVVTSVGAAIYDRYGKGK